MKIARNIIGTLVLCVLFFYAVIGFAFMHLTEHISEDYQQCMIIREEPGQNWCMNILKEVTDANDSTQTK